MRTPATKPETTEPNTPQVIQLSAARIATAAMMRTELPSVPISRARNRFFWVASSLHRTMNIPAIESKMPKPATTIGESTAFSGVMPSGNVARAKSWRDKMYLILNRS